MENYKFGNLCIEVTENDENIEFTWLGKSDDREPSNTLTPYFHDAIATIESKNVTINFAKLEYMNSSTVRPILTLMKTLNDEKIKSIFTYDPKVTFQKTSFSAISMLAKNMNYIDIIKI